MALHDSELAVDPCQDPRANGRTIEPGYRANEALSLEQGVERLDGVLLQVSRTEACLGQLLRGLKQLTQGASVARAANAELLLELEHVRVHLARSQAEEHVLRLRAGQLEQLLNLLRNESARERDFLIQQQDSFLRQLLTDHERHCERLQAQLGLVQAASADEELVAELRLQRDQAREYATRCERERDLAWQELGQSSPPSAPSAVGEGAGTAIAAIQLRTAISE